MTQVDTTIFLRALSIFAIVSGHFGFVGLAGGSYFLIALSGYNFVKFTRPKFFSSDKDDLKHVASVYFKFIIKLIIPTFLYLFLLHSVFGEYHFYSLFLVSNFIGPHYAGGFSYWFLEVLLQIYLVFFIILMFPKMRKFLHEKAFSFFFFGTCIFFVVSSVSSYYFDYSQLMGRLPHLLMYLFFFGGLIATSSTGQRKFISSLTLLSICTWSMSYSFNSMMIFLVLACLLVLWVPIIYLPSFATWPIEKIAMSSLFIYLCHFQARSLLRKIIEEPQPWLETVFALIVGAIIAEVWKKRRTIFWFAYTSIAALFQRNFRLKKKAR